MARLRGGLHYPRSVGEFQAWFRTDGDCLDYLEWLRWPGGFTCPSCGYAGGWRLGDGRYECVGCHGRTSVTAGTIFDRTRTPLTVWFTACWLFATAKDGISALSLQRPATRAGEDEPVITWPGVAHDVCGQVRRDQLGYRHSAHTGLGLRRPEQARRLAAPLARRQRRALGLGRPARRTPGHTTQRPGHRRRWVRA
jgi:Transposase zinc-ribbon domain